MNETQNTGKITQILSLQDDDSSESVSSYI